MSGRPLDRRGRVFVIRGPIASADVAELCERARQLFAEADKGPVVCHVEALPADLAAVDALARLTLTARRLHRGIQLCGAAGALRELLALAGLASVVPCDGRSGFDPGR